LGNVTDNASNNDTYVQNLGWLLPDNALTGQHTHIRCFAHVLNLVVKAMLKQFD
ncbi:hypothetical protein K435DRAFT_556266, partial [Dendrothele bispora CBS 962.96]